MLPPSIQTAYSFKQSFLHGNGSMAPAAALELEISSSVINIPKSLFNRDAPFGRNHSAGAVESSSSSAIPNATPKRK